MRKYGKKIVAMLLAVVMMVTLASANQVSVYAVEAAQGSTSGIDEPVEATVNAEVYFVHYATNKVVTMSGVVDELVDCTVGYDANNIPDNAKMTVYYGIGNWGDSDGKEVVNFVNRVNERSWRVTEEVKQYYTVTKPTGWESVRIEPQGDGTIAFISCSNGNYVTIKDEQLGTVEIKTDEGEAVSNNEKFVMYTETAPKAAKKVELSNIAGDSMTVSWEGVTETLYSGYEVLYSTDENGEYESAGYTTKTTIDITNLELNTTYYVKVRTLTNNENGPYAESKIAYATTLKDYKPSKPTGLEVEEKNNQISLTWDTARGANKYKVYRAVSRFAEYVEIGETTDTTFVDKNPNASKYQNYYKIKGANDADTSDFSEPGSLEISMFGSNAYIFAPTDNQVDIDSIAADIFEQQHYSQFGSNRFALMFKPGDYTSTGVAIEQGYYTQTLGLGKTPYDVRLANVKTPAAVSGNNVTCNFWQGIENVTIADLDNNNDDYFSFQWAVSQAAPARRLNVERKAVFDWWNGWASGGFFADTYFHKAAGSYSQQQYYYRNCQMDGGVFGVNWNMVAQGCVGITNENSSDNSGKAYANMVSLLSSEGKTNWDQRGCSTIITETAEIREKPFLYFDTEEDKYEVFIPAMRKNATGISWSENNMGQGTSISVDKCFYIARADRDTAKTINEQLDAGKNIIFSPGVYRVDEPIRITHANTVVLGIGLATIIPDNEEAAITIADVGGVSVAGLILDAGNYSEALLVAGEEGCNKDHSDNPTVLQDVIYRVGGTGELGRADQCQVINSNDVIIDHTWIWRADHGDYVGWNQNTSKNGLVVNGDNVTAYGLFCEHFQEYDIIWRGENGKTYFLQNEKCYDPQDQAAWMSHNGTKLGYAAYKVANNVKNHYAVGLGVYDVFINTNGASIYLDNAIEVPNTPGVLIENACIVEIANGEGPKVGINHIVNDTTAGIRTGAGNNGGYAIQRLLSYSNEESKSLPDYYEVVSQYGEIGKESPLTENSYVNESGETPLNDVYAEKDIVKEPSSKDDEKPLWEMTETDFENRYGIVTVNVPTAVKGLVYNGKEQTGIIETSTYTVENNTGIEAGTYTATVTLKDSENYQWSDSEFDGTVEWSISKKDIQVIGLTATNRKYESGNSIVEITGGNLVGVVAGDKEEVIATLPTLGIMEDDVAGNQKKVTVEMPTISGSKAGNYVISSINDIYVDIEKDIVAVPTVVEDLVYNGLEQTGVVESDLYTVENNTGIEAGTYVATVILKDSENYQWSDAEFDGTIEWSIAKKEIQITDLVATKRKYESGNSNVEITGGTLVGIVPGDEAEVIVQLPTVGTMENDAVGGQKKVTVEMPTISGSKAGNYVISSINDIYVDIEAVELINVTELKKGQKFSIGKYTYKITKVTGKKGNVTLVKVRKKYRKSIKKAVVKVNVKYKGYSFKVTVIGKNAFKNCKKLKKVTIGKNVKTIKAKAFNKCNKLKKVVVKGKKLKKIAKNAFAKKVRKSLKIKAKKAVKKRILKSLKRKK